MRLSAVFPLLQYAFVKRIALILIFALYGTISGAVDVKRITDSLEKLIPHASDKDKLEIYYSLVYYFQNTEPEKSNQYLLKRLKLARKMKLTKPEAECLCDLGQIYEARGLPDSSMFYYDQAITFCTKHGHKMILAKVLRVQGSLFWEMGKNSKSTECFLQSLKICEEIKDTTGMIQTYINLAVIYNGADNKKYALELDRKALELVKKTGNFQAEGYIYNNMGSIYLEMKDYDQALHYFMKSIPLKKKVFVQQGGIAVTYNNIGEIYYFKKNWKKALEYYKLALEIDTEFGKKYTCSFIHLNMAFVYRKIGMPDSAYNHLMEGLKLALSIPAPAPLKMIYKELADYYKQKGDYFKAYEYLQKYSVIADTLVPVELKEKLAKHESEKITSENLLLKKEKEIEQLKGQRSRNQRNFMIVVAVLILGLSMLIFSRFLLKRKTNQILAAKNTELEVANSSKDRFFAIIAHDLKNQLTAFQTVSSMLAENYFRIDEEKKQHLLQRLSSSVNSTYRLLENLLSWSASQLGYLKFNPSKLNLPQLTDKLLSEFDLHLQKKNLSARTDVPADLMVFADPDMLTLIMRNLLSNAIKYSPDESTIEISAHVHDGQAFISVKDHGEGLSKEDCEKLFSLEADVKKIGKTQEKGSGLGLVLSKDFVERNKGIITVETGTDFGCKFTFSLPLFTGGQADPSE